MKRLIIGLMTLVVVASSASPLLASAHSITIKSRILLIALLFKQGIVKLFMKIRKPVKYILQLKLSSLQIKIVWDYVLLQQALFL